MANQEGVYVFPVNIKNCLFAAMQDLQRAYTAVSLAPYLSEADYDQAERERAVEREP